MCLEPSPLRFCREIGGLEAKVPPVLHCFSLNVPESFDTPFISRCETPAFKQHARVGRKLAAEPVAKHVRLFPMPRYYFHVYHDRPELDHEGEDLPDKHAAWKEATVMAGQTLQSLDGKLQPGRGWRMEVTDEFENPLYVLHIHAEKPR